MTFPYDFLTTTISFAIIGLMGVSVYLSALIYVWFRDRKNKIHAQQETQMEVVANSPAAHPSPVDGTMKIVKQNVVTPIA